MSIAGYTLQFTGHNRHIFYQTWDAALAGAAAFMEHMQQRYIAITQCTSEKICNVNGSVGIYLTTSESGEKQTLNIIALYTA